MIIPSPNFPLLIGVLGAFAAMPVGATDFTGSGTPWSTAGVHLTFDGNEGLLLDTVAGGRPGRASVRVPAAAGEGSAQVVEISARMISGGAVRVFAADENRESLHRLGEVAAPGFASLTVPEALSRGAGDWHLLFELPAGGFARLESVQERCVMNQASRRQAVIADAYLDGNPRQLPEVLHSLAGLTPSVSCNYAAISNWAASQPAWQRSGPWIVARAGGMLALFLEHGKRVTLENLVDLNRGARTHTRRGFWDVSNIWSISTPAGRLIEPDEDWTFSMDSGEREGEIVMKWNAPAADGEVVRSVEASVLLNAGSGDAEWKLRWVVGQSPDLYACVFPKLGGILSDSPGDQLFAPRGQGLIFDNAFQTKASADFSYPSPHMMQFGSYSTRGGDNGLYWAVHDASGAIKHMTARAMEAGMSFAFTHYADHGAGLSAWAMGYPVITRPFAGDWFDAAVIYRKWAAQQSWVASGRMPSGKFSRLLEMDGWLWMSGWANSSPPLQEYLDAFSDFRMAVLNHDWRQDAFDRNYPVYVARNPTMLGAHIASVHAKRGMWVPYFNVRAWQRETETWFSEGAGNHEIINRDGTPALDYFLGAPQSVMDPASGFWQAKVVAFVGDTQAQYGIDGAYLDQLGASYPRFNYMDGSPGKADPLSWTSGQLAIASQVAQACRQTDPGYFSITESCMETFIAHRAGALLFYKKYLADHDRWVPAYQAVYHPYDLSFGQPSLPSQPQYYYTASVDLNSGNMPFLNIQTRLAEAGRAADFFRECMMTYRANKPFLAWGEMLRPPAVACDGVDVDWEWRGETGVAAQRPSVLASAWRAPDGSVLLLAVNHTDQPRAFTLRHSEKWTPADARLFQEGRFSLRRQNAETIIEGSLPPNGIQAFVSEGAALLVEDFEEWSTGPVASQMPVAWTKSEPVGTAIHIVNTTASSGAKSLSLTDDSATGFPAIALALNTVEGVAIPVASGLLRVRMDILNTGANQDGLYIRIRNSSGADLGGIRFGTTGNQFQYLDASGAFSAIAGITYAPDTWHSVELAFDLDARTYSGIIDGQAAFAGAPMRSNISAADAMHMVVAARPGLAANTGGGFIDNIVVTTTPLIAPAITIQPRSQTTPEGSNAAFSVTAAGSPPLRYQWKKNDTLLTDDGHISCASTSAMTVAGVRHPDAGAYSVIVSNAAGITTSQNAMLAVNDNPDNPPLGFANSDITTFTIGLPCSFTFTAPGTPKPVFVASGLPGWATLDPDTGVLSGAPPANTTPGSWLVTVIASNGTSPDAMQTFTLHAHPPPTITTPLSVTTLSGIPGTPGAIDGDIDTARFRSPIGITTDDMGNIILSDADNHAIRKITQTGAVSALAGHLDAPGFADGHGAAARFNFPSGIATDAAGNYYVADTLNHIIRKITPTGQVSTVAGQPGHSGDIDGIGATARFFAPQGLALDASQTSLYIADTNNHTVRKIDLATHNVSTVAGFPGISGSADGIGATARFNEPCDVAVDASGTIYVADTNNNTVRVIAAGGVVSTIAGTAGSSGAADGTGASARFDMPTAIAADESGVYVVDTAHHTIRKIDMTTKAVSTIAGLAGASGQLDGAGAGARFNQPSGIFIDANGDIFIADTANHTLRKGTLINAPAIQAHPQSQTANVGDTVSFSVLATGHPAPSFQWCFNGAPIPAATSSTYTLKDAQPSHAGRYSVVVSNQLGSTTSQDAMLEMRPGQSGNNNEGGGGGGALSAWLLSALAILCAARLASAAMSRRKTL